MPPSFGLARTVPPTRDALLPASRWFRIRRRLDAQTQLAVDCFVLLVCSEKMRQLRVPGLTKVPDACPEGATTLRAGRSIPFTMFV